MEPVLIATDNNLNELCAIRNFTLDMVIGHDRQDFTASFAPIDNVGGGSLLYIDGTEYGGIVDDVTTDTETDIVTCHGRTWDGILAAKIIMPPADATHRTVSGEANSVLASLVTLLDVGDVFAASTDDSGITISSYSFDRFTDGYSGIVKMLQSADAKLVMRRLNGKTVISAEEAETIEGEADSDLMDFAMTKVTRCVNHLVCAGIGEGTERVVIDLYANARGQVSTTKTFQHRYEITAFFDYPNAESDELLAEGTKQLQSYQTRGSVDISRIGRGDWNIGDTLSVRDNRLGVTVSTPIVGKTVNVGKNTDWQLKVDYEIGEASRTAASSSGMPETQKLSTELEDATALGIGAAAPLSGLKVGLDATFDNDVSVTGDFTLGQSVTLGSATISDPSAWKTALGIGEVVSNYISTGVSAASSTYKSIGSISLTAGKWVITYGARFASNSTGVRTSWISATENAQADQEWKNATMVQSNATGNAETYLHGSHVYDSNSASTIYLSVWQNSGSSILAYGYIAAIKIA